MIPDEKSTAVSNGIREAFGTSVIEDIRPMPARLGSDLIFRIVVNGSPFQLTIMTRRDEINDPQRTFGAMRAMAEAGLSPAMRHVNTEDGIAINDFVEKSPFPVSVALSRIPEMLRKLHALPRFSKTFNYVTAHNGFIWRFRGANLLPRTEVEEVFARYEQLCAVYPRLDADMVSCHGDLKPENILFDGRRLWLVGWKAAMVNDRYFDLAVAANFLVAGETDRMAYLEDYFGRPADEYQSARFFLMSQVVHMLSATVYLLLGSAGTPIDGSTPIPGFRDFHQRVWAGEVDLGDNAMKTLYGRVHWNQLLQNLRAPGFDEALKIVSSRAADPTGIQRLLPSAP